MLSCSYLHQSCNHSKNQLWTYSQTYTLNWENLQVNLSLQLPSRPQQLWMKWSTKLMLSFLNLKTKLKKLSSPILIVKLVTFSRTTRIILRKEQNLSQFKKKNRKKTVKRRLDNQYNKEEEISMIPNKTEKILKNKLRKCLWNSLEKESIITLELQSEHSGKSSQKISVPFWLENLNKKCNIHCIMSC